MLSSNHSTEGGTVHLFIFVFHNQNTPLVYKKPKTDRSSNVAPNGATPRKAGQFFDPLGPELGNVEGKGNGEALHRKPS